MRFLLLAATLCACSSTPQPRPRLPAAHEKSQPHETAPRACFAEPVVYWRMTAAALPERDLDARLRACDTAPCRFLVAREYFDGRRYERAAPVFLQIAHGSTSLLSAEAAELALESLVALGDRTNPSRPDCYDLLASEVPKLLDEYCTPAPVVGSKKLCAVLFAADVDMTRCSECRRGSVSGRDPDCEQLTAARLFVETAMERCFFGHGKQKANETLRCDELLYRAYELYQFGGSEGRAREVRRFFLDPRNGLDETDLALRLKGTPGP